MSDAARAAGREFRCPFGCGKGPFEGVDEWADHQREDHGVDGPI